MAIKLLLMVFMNTLFQLINAVPLAGTGSVSAVSQSSGGVMNSNTSNWHRALAHLHPNLRFRGHSSTLSFSDSSSFPSKHLPKLHMRHHAAPKAIAAGVGGHGEDYEKQHLTGDRAYKEWLYYRTMAMLPKEDKVSVHIIFCGKLADKKGIDREQRMQDKDWLLKIHFMKMPRNDFMVALAETLVQHFDGEGDLNDHLDAEIRKEAHFMEVIEDAKYKFEKENKEAQKKIHEHFIASEGSAQRIPPSEEANELLNNKKSYTIWLYHNMMAMFRPGQQAGIHNILVKKLQEGMDWKDLLPNTFEVVLAETLVDYLKDNDNIERFSAENFSISVIVKFMAEKRLKREEKQKFMESYLHLFAENCHLLIGERLEAAFEV